MKNKNRIWERRFLLIFISGLLFFHLTGFGQGITNVRFDLSKVPFSRYGSYMSLSTADRDSNDVNELFLYELSGKNIWAFNGVLKIEPTEKEHVIPVDYEATPLQVEGHTREGDLTFYFETSDILHVLSNGPGVVMSGEIDPGNTLPVPGLENTWKLRDSRFVVTIRTGKGGFQEINGNWAFRVLPDNGSLDVVIEQYKSDWLPKSYKRTYRESMAELKKELIKWEIETPETPSSYGETRSLASYINWSCMVKPNGNITRYGMVMSKNWMYNIWSWDNCFNAISLSYHQPEASWNQLMLLFDQQDTTGAIPDYVDADHMVWEFRKPPVHGWTLSKLMKEYSLSEQQLKTIYQKLSAWTNYWFNYRDGNHNGLPEYYHGNDSGWDNSSAFDVGFPAEGPDLAAFLIVQMDVLADVARKTGLPEEAVRWEKRADETQKRMIAAFWNGNEFISKNIVTGESNPQSQSLMSYLPIILGKRLPTDICKKMVTDLKQMDFMVTPYGLASESPQSKLYEPDGYWRGPIWAPVTFIVIDGLKQLGEDNFAKELAQKFCNTCRESGFAENFNALTGEALRDPAYTWTSSVFLVLAHDYLLKNGYND